jgi:hypothetical protein
MRLEVQKYAILFEFSRGTALKSAADPGGLLGDAALWQLGGMLLFDVLINNWDRMPLRGVWTNEGNLGNVLVDGKNVTIIDQTVTVIPLQHRAPYLAAIDAFFRDVCAWRAAGGETCDPDDTAVVTACMAATKNSDTDGYLLDTVRLSLILHTGHDIGLRGEVVMLQGLCAALRTLGLWGPENSGKTLTVDAYALELRKTLHSVKGETLHCVLGNRAGEEAEAEVLESSLDECVEFCEAVLDCVMAAGEPSATF